MCNKHVLTSDRRYKKSELKIRQTIDTLNLLTKPSYSLDIRGFCNAAGLDRTAFYRHYKSLDEAVDKYRADIERDFYELCGQVYHPEHRPEIDFFIIFSHFHHHRDFYRKLFDARQLAPLDPVIKRLREIAIHKWLTVVPDLPESRQDRLFFDFSYDFIKELGFWICLEGADLELALYHVKKLSSRLRALPKYRPAVRYVQTSEVARLMRKVERANQNA